MNNPISNYRYKILIALAITTFSNYQESLSSNSNQTSGEPPVLTPCINAPTSYLGSFDCHSPSQNSGVSKYEILKDYTGEFNPILQEMETEESIILDFIKKVRSNSKDADPEIMRVVSEKFWDCI